MYIHADTSTSSCLQAIQYSPSWRIFISKVDTNMVVPQTDHWGTPIFLDTPIRSTLHIMDVSEQVASTDFSDFCGSFIVHIHGTLPTVGPEKPWYFAPAMRNSRDLLVVTKCWWFALCWRHCIFGIVSCCCFGNILIFEVIWGWCALDCTWGFWRGSTYLCTSRYASQCGNSPRFLGILPLIGSMLTPSQVVRCCFVPAKCDPTIKHPVLRDGVKFPRYPPQVKSQPPTAWDYWYTVCVYLLYSLVGGLDYVFPYIGNLIIPID